MYKQLSLLLLAFATIVVQAQNKKHPRYRQRQKMITAHDRWKNIKPVAHKPITIIVHGTGIWRRFVPLLKEQASTPAGIHPLSRVSNFYHYARLARQLSNADPEQFPAENLYLFGWSAALSYKHRAQAGAELYEFLSYLADEPDLRQTPVTIITVSHGGNVALNSAAWARQKGDRRMLVDRLIMLCCPIQHATQEFAGTPTFKKVIHCYSSSDLIQIADPQGWYTQGCCPKQAHSIFSDRIFATPTANILQIEVKSSRCKLGHIDFVTRSFHKKLPRIIEMIEDEVARALLRKNRHGIHWIDICAI